jgi:hypothetical protein
MPNRIVDVVDALNAGVASGGDFFVTVMDDGCRKSSLMAVAKSAAKNSRAARYLAY